MIVQQDPYLKPLIQKFGCYYMCILFIVNRHTRKGFDRKVINDLYDFFIGLDWMEKDCYVKHPVEIFNYLGFPVSSIRVEGRDYICDDDEIEILRFERSYERAGVVITYGHFVCGNGNGCVTFDPSGISNAVRLGYLESKRIFSIGG